MSTPRLIDWPYVIGLTLLPVALEAVLLLAGKLQWVGRYAPAYFSRSTGTATTRPGRSSPTRKRLCKTVTGS